MVIFVAAYITIGALGLNFGFFKKKIACWMVTIASTHAGWLLLQAHMLGNALCNLIIEAREVVASFVYHIHT